MSPHDLAALRRQSEALLGGEELRGSAEDLYGLVRDLSGFLEEATLEELARPTDSPISRIQAGDGTRTRDPQLVRLMLYQLSYTRDCRARIHGGGRIRTYVGR